VKPILELSHVWVWLGKTLALRDVSMQVREASFIGLLGPNGGGKTTLLKTMAGLLAPDRGEVKLPRPEERAIGYVPQERLIDPDFPMTVRDVVEMGLYQGRRPFGRTGDRRGEQIAASLQRVGLSDLASRRIGEISGGQKQRAFIARAIVGRPRLLLLDEPTTGIDTPARDDFYRLLHSLKQELSLAIVLASHDIEVVPGNVDEIVCINQRIFVHAPPDRIGDPDGFRQAYGCELEFLMHGDHPHRVVQRHDETEDA
jgi:zinc transport system ATP-binding protein